MFDRLFGGAAAFPSINPREAWERLSSHSSGGAQTPPVLIDVREPGEFASGRAKGAKNIPMSQLAARVNEFPRNRDVLLICQSGNRSRTAAHYLQAHGIERVINVSGGTTVWRMHGLPMEGGRR